MAKSAQRPPRSIAISGGAGNLGQKLAAAFASASWCNEVVLIDRVPAPVAPGTVSVVADLCDPTDGRWLEVVSQVDAIVHLAADNPYPDCTWLEASRSLDMTANLAMAASSHRTRFVFASSNHVMGGYKEQEVPAGELTTISEPDPGTRFHTPYGPRRDVAYAVAKLAGERVVSCAANTPGALMTAVSLRIGWCQPGENDPRTLTGDGLKPDAKRDAAYAGYSRDLHWFRSMWLSNRDLVAVMSAALLADESNWDSRAIVANAMSANLGMPWDLTASARLLGFQPQDNVWDHVQAHETVSGEQMDGA